MGKGGEPNRNEVWPSSDYGWEFITEKQYERYLEIFRQGEDALKNHEKTVNELALGILERIAASVRADRREWEFCALTPKQQEEESRKAQENQRAWKEKIARLKKERNKG